MIALFPMPLSWLLGRSVLKPGKTQSWRKPSPHLRDVWIARNMNGERTQSRSLLERISQVRCLCKAEKRMKVSGSHVTKLKSFSGTSEGSSQHNLVQEA